MSPSRQRILIVLGHPSGESLSAAMAERYREGAVESGADVRLLRLGELDFDPLLHHGYREPQPLEPDLETAQANILWAQHLVFVYPVWWGTQPALLKGFLDRVFLPGFAFRYRKDSAWWDRLLSGRSARLIVLMDTPPWYYRWIWGRPGHRQMRNTVLEFCGIRPVRISEFGPVRGAAADRRQRWLDEATRLGRGLR